MAGTAASAAFPDLTQLTVEWIGPGEGMPCWALPATLRTLRIRVRASPGVFTGL